MENWSKKNNVTDWKELFQMSTKWQKKERKRHYKMLFSLDNHPQKKIFCIESFLYHFNFCQIFFHKTKEMTNQAFLLAAHHGFSPRRRIHPFVAHGRPLPSPTLSGEVDCLDWVLPLVKLKIWTFGRRNSASCDCPPDCSFTTYSVTPSSSPLRLSGWLIY